MCDNCVKAGRMTQSEADEQKELFASLLGAPETLFAGPPEMTAEDMMMMQLLSNPDSGNVIISKFLGVMAQAGWTPAVVKNQTTGETAIAYVHVSGEGGAHPVCVIPETAAKAIAEMPEL
jgi:hypothetical protein